MSEAIGPVDKLKLEDARTLAAYWLMANSENRRQIWESEIKKICESLLAVTEEPTAPESCPKCGKTEAHMCGKTPWPKVHEVKTLPSTPADPFDERYKKMWEDLKRSAEMHILRCQPIDGQDLKNRMDELESSQEGTKP